jgi:hypothetical protein
MQPDSRRLFTRRTHRRSSRRQAPLLGPRSLDPAALFGARLPSLFEAGRRLLTSATTFASDVRATQPGLLILAGTEAATPFLFLCATLASLTGAVTHGEPRNVHSPRARSWFLPVARVCPTAISFRMRHLQRLSTMECSDDQRARVSGPSEGRHQPERKWLVALASGACALVGACRCRSPPRTPEDTLCPRYIRWQGRKPTADCR